MEHLFRGDGSGQIPPDAKARPVGIGEDHHLFLRRQPPDKGQLFLVRKDLEPVGLEDVPFDEGGQPGLVVPPFHDDRVFHPQPLHQAPSISRKISATVVSSTTLASGPVVFICLSASASSSKIRSRVGMENFRWFWAPLS